MPTRRTTWGTTHCWKRPSADTTRSSAFLLTTTPSECSGPPLPTAGPPHSLPGATGECLVLDLPCCYEPLARRPTVRMPLFSMSAEVGSNSMQIFIMGTQKHIARSGTHMQHNGQDACSLCTADRHPVHLWPIRSAMWLCSCSSIVNSGVAVNPAEATVISYCNVFITVCA